jgi:hypothetical protein
MRRLAARGAWSSSDMGMRLLMASGPYPGKGRQRNQHNDDSAAKGQFPSWTERRLLDVYWTVSGYGLRAWRALTALTVLLLACAGLFTLPTSWATPTTPSPSRWSCAR